ncbi:hypothetical protein [Conchiformibius steedae]|uniref:hypothetical protein n=1 Tax=Conchiformibius steedae TaxID=153493 RepID=UPI0026EB3C95|nr:hypothetical protein [Conchiformibius steedae]
MDSWLIIINVLSGLAVMWYAAGKLGNKQYGDWDAGLYVHSCVLVAAMVVVYDSLAYTRAHHWSEVCFNAAVAMYFVRRMWRAWQMRGLPQGIHSDVAKSYIQQQGKSKC